MPVSILRDDAATEACLAHARDLAQWLNDPIVSSRHATECLTAPDTTAPTLDGCPADVTVGCKEVPPRAAPCATDDCSNVTISFQEDEALGPCLGTADDLPAQLFQLLRLGEERDGRVREAEGRLDAADGRLGAL